MVSTSGSYRAWLCVAALGLAMALGWQAYGQPAQQANAGDPNAAAKPRDGAKPRAPSEKAVKAPAVYKPECLKPRDSEEYSLCVNIAAAEAAKKATDLANAQVRLGWLQIGGLLISLVFTGWAAVAAAHAAKAARDSVEDARSDAAEQAHRFTKQLMVSQQAADAATVAAASAKEQIELAEKRSIMQLRAYVFVIESNIREIGIGKRPQAYVKIKNTGNTPAYDCFTWIGIGLIPYIQGDPPPSCPDELRKPRNAIGPSDEKHIIAYLGSDLTEFHINQIISGELCFRLVGGIEYTDTFGIIRETRFNMVYGGPYALNENGSPNIEFGGNFAT